MSSSYGDEIYYNIGESNSEMDDLDNEVQVISSNKRQQNARQNAQGDTETGEFAMSGAEAGKMKTTGALNQNYVSPDEIRIIIDDEKGDDRSAGMDTDTPQRARKPNLADT